MSSVSGQTQSKSHPITNAPFWTPSLKGPFTEAWYVKVNDLESKTALWLRFTILVSKNGFRKIAETWAVLFERKESREVQHIAIKQTLGIQQFASVSNGGATPTLNIGNCVLTETHTRGAVQSKGKAIQWDLTMVPAQETRFNLVPEALSRSGMLDSFAITTGEDIRFTGWVDIDGRKLNWTAAPGMIGHHGGTRAGHSWVWGHCNTFTNEQGKPAPFIFEGISARARLGGILPSPQLSSFYFFYQGQPYAFNSIWDGLRSRSTHDLTTWTFQADRGELSFRGEFQAEYREFAGITYEDTDGSYLYCANSKLASLRIHVYRRGKLEASFSANGSAAFEVVSRQKNPYVPMIL